MWTWEKIKGYYKRINWFKLVMSFFTLIVLISFGIAVINRKDFPALSLLSTFYKWAIVIFAGLHEYNRLTASAKDEMPPLSIIQGEWYVTVFILTTVILLFFTIIDSGSFTTLPNSLSDLIELTKWVAVAFGFTRVSKVINEKNTANNLAKLSNNLTKMGLKAPETPAEKKPE